MKMRSQFVTEETLRSTEESSKPPPPPEPVEDEEEAFYDDELDEEGSYDDFEDDDYEDPELVLANEEAAELDSESEESVESQPEELEPEPEEVPEEAVDHRVARLRQLRSTFVTEKDLQVKATSEPTFYKEVEIARIFCPNCQAEEPRGRRVCSKCGARLPNIVVEEEKYNPGSLNKAVLKYFNAVAKLQDESWTIDEFVDFLQERYDLSRNQIDALLEYIEECETQEWLPEATTLITKSTLLLEESILTMLEKVEEVYLEHAELEQMKLEAEAEAQSRAQDGDSEDERAEEGPIEVPDVEEMLLAIDFQPELKNIENANNMMLDALRQIDRFQKEAQDDLEVSM